MIEENALTHTERGSLGGEARAARLTKERRSAIARQAAESRWSHGVLRATHVGDFKIGDKEISAAVLENGKRVLTQESFLSAIGRARKAKAGTGSTALVDGLPPFLQADYLKRFISEELRQSTTPILFRNSKGGRAFGYDAELLPMVCEVYLKLRDTLQTEAARRKEPVKLPRQSEHIIVACDVLMRGLARVGIVALVDEATGYQDARAKDALAKILEAFIAKELRKWISTFPLDYYKELFRLRGWKFPNLPEDQRKRPILVGKITNDVVYDRLAPGVRQELVRLTPRNEKGRLKHKLFQHLTRDTGHPKLLEHLAAVISLMRASDTWHQFTHMLNRALPRYGDTPYLPFEG
jgi:hypothetical protein